MNEPLRMCFWFLIPQYQAQLLDSKTLMPILEMHGITMHPSPSQEFSDFILLSTRLRPPDAKTWKQRYGVDVFGVTYSLDDLLPEEELVNAITTRRKDERRSTVRAGGVTQDEAYKLCSEQELWGYRLCLSSFRRKGQPDILLWTVWFEDRSIQAVIVRQGRKAIFKWAGEDGVWPFRNFTFQQVASPGIVVEKGK